MAFTESYSTPEALTCNMHVSVHACTSPQDLRGQLRSVASEQAAAYLRLEGCCDGVTHIACAFTSENLIPMRDARVLTQQPPMDCRTVSQCASFLANVIMHDPDPMAALR